MTSEAIYEPSGARRSLPPLDFALPSWDASPMRTGRSSLGLVIGLFLYGVAAWMAGDNGTFRRFEAQLVSPVAGFVTGRHGATTSNTLVYFALGTRRAFGLQITSECTSALLLIPLFVMMGSFAIFTKLSMRRQLIALVAGAGLILATNAIRVGGIAWATWRFGFNPGYEYSHVFVGSALSLIGFVGAMLVALWILVRTERIKQAAATISRAWWAATAPAAHRLSSAGRASRRDRLPPAHRYRRR